MFEPIFFLYFVEHKKKIHLPLDFVYRSYVALEKNTHQSSGVALAHIKYTNAIK